MKSVYVINMDPTSKDGDLLTAFKNKATGVIKARVLQDKEGKSKCCGFVDFSSPADAQEAYKSCQNIDVGNKRVIVQMARQ